MTTTRWPEFNARSMTATLAEADLYFLGQGALNNTLTQLAEDLKSRGIDYVVIGAVAARCGATAKLRIRAEENNGRDGRLLGVRRLGGALVRGGLTPLRLIHASSQ